MPDVDFNRIRIYFPRMLQSKRSQPFLIPTTFQKQKTLKATATFTHAMLQYFYTHNTVTHTKLLHTIRVRSDKSLKHERCYVFVLSMKSKSIGQEFEYLLQFLFYFLPVFTMDISYQGFTTKSRDNFLLETCPGNQKLQKWPDRYFVIG